MATIIFIDGTTKDVGGAQAFKMQQILKGLKPGTIEQQKFVERIDSIRFTPKRSEYKPPKRVPIGRLPYADD